MALSNPFNPPPNTPLLPDPQRDSVWRRWFEQLWRRIQTGALGGTVTSVAVTAPVEFSVSGSPITTSGTIAITKANETANTVWAGPTTGAAAQPAFRSLVTADLPAGTGTVTSVSVTTANGVSGSVANPTTTPAITLTLGAITPSSVAAVGAVTGSNLSGTNTGDQTITLTGNVTGSGTGSFAATIANDAVTYAKMQNVSAASRLLGRGSAAGAGDVEEITISTGLTLTGTTLTASGTGGTVTSVDVSGGTTGLTFSGGPITASGTITMAGTLDADNGGTGFASYAVGDILYASTTTALSKLADVATGNALISGGVGVAPSWGKIGLTTHVSGTLPVANGGTGNTALAALTKTDDTNVTLTLGGSPTTALVNAASITAGWTGTLAATRGGTGTGTVTTGDLLYGSAANTWSKLADVATGNALISGGVGVAPSWGKIGISTHVSGLGTGVATALGVNTGSAGAVVLFNGALGTPSSGTVTNLTGTASININGTVGATTPAAGTFTTLKANTSLDLSGVADTAVAASHYYVETATDGFIRPKTLANVKTEIVTTAAVNAAAATTVGTVTSGTWNATNIALAKGGTGASLVDPNADRIMFWDDSAGTVAWLTAGTGLSISGTTISATATELKIIYNNENLTIATNVQVTGHTEMSFTGTGELIISGTGSLALL